MRDAAKGLCVNCRHLPTCVFSNREEGVQRCEEYEFDEPGSRRVRSGPDAGAEPPGAAAADRPTAQEESEKLLGLCVNCENRRTCISRKQPGGVWHCGEYR